MAHIRTQIRNRFKSVLEAGLPATWDVFENRRYARNFSTDRVRVDMTINNDQTQLVDEQNDSRIHIASLYLRVQRSARDEDMDDAQDADEVRIVDLIEAANWSDILEQDPELLQVNSADDAEGERIVATLVMRYDCEYRIEKSDPETPIA
jgi:hypothetical protein